VVVRWPCADSPRPRCVRTKTAVADTAGCARAPAHGPHRRSWISRPCVALATTRLARSARTTGDWQRGRCRCSRHARTHAHAHARLRPERRAVNIRAADRARAMDGDIARIVTVIAPYITARHLDAHAHAHAQIKHIFSALKRLIGTPHPAALTARAVLTGMDWRDRYRRTDRSDRNAPHHGSSILIDLASGSCATSRAIHSPQSGPTAAIDAITYDYFFSQAGGGSRVKRVTTRRESAWLPSPPEQDFTRRKRGDRNRR